MKQKQLFFMLGIVLLISFACSLPAGIGQSGSGATTSASSGPSASAATGTATPGAPTGAAATSLAHSMMPGEPSENPPTYDNEAHSTANFKYASNGDLYPLNRFERSFTQKDMTYLPYLDIQKFNMSKDANWFYGAVTLYDLSSMSSGPAPIYGIEIDYDLDGRGDYLLWAKPPFTTDWSTAPISVYEDANHDVGGPHPNLADPSNKAGDGYETKIFDAGQGKDPDLAWVRINPKDTDEIQFAFKRSLIPGGSFEWAAWADAGIKDPGKFAYNDRMSLAEAGSPLKGSSDYPLKGLFAVDNTCYDAYGVSTGYQPLICPISPTPTKKPHPGVPATPGPTATEVIQ